MYYNFLESGREKELIDSNKNTLRLEVFCTTSDCALRLVTNAATIISDPDSKNYVVKQAKCVRLRARGRA